MALGGIIANDEKNALQHSQETESKQGQQILNLRLFSEPIFFSVPPCLGASVVGFAWLSADCGVLIASFQTRLIT